MSEVSSRALSHKTVLEKKSELRGFTFENLKERGAEHYIRMQEMNKEELIDALCEAGVWSDGAEMATGACCM